MTHPATERDDSLFTIVWRVVGGLESLSAGDLADLRRLDPDEAPGFAFYKVMAQWVDRSPPGRSSAAQDQQEQRWSVVLQALASLGSLSQRGAPLGTALANAGFSELRLQRLLRGDDATLFDGVRRMAAFLVSKHEPVDPVQLARLLLLRQPDAATSLRRAIARDYFRTLHHAS